MDLTPENVAWLEWSEVFTDQKLPPYSQDDLEEAFRAAFSMGKAEGETHDREPNLPMIGLHESLVVRDEKRSYD